MFKRLIKKVLSIEGILTLRSLGMYGLVICMGVGTWGFFKEGMTLLGYTFAVLAVFYLAIHVLGVIIENLLKKEQAKALEMYEQLMGDVNAPEDTEDTNSNIESEPLELGTPDDFREAVQRALAAIPDEEK